MEITVFMSQLFHFQMFTWMAGSLASGITWSYLFDGPGGTGAAGCIPGGSAGDLLASNGSGGCESAFIQVNGSNLNGPNV